MAYILVVDDDVASRAVVRTLLEDAGHEVVLADEGEEALVMLRTRLPDVVITDLYMDDPYVRMEGMEFLRRVHTDMAVGAGGCHVVQARRRQRARDGASPWSSWFARQAGQPRSADSGSE